MPKVLLVILQIFITNTIPTIAIALGSYVKDRWLSVHKNAKKMHKKVKGKFKK